MTTGHLSDEMIQQFSLEAASIDEASKAHIAGCKHCKLQMENYRTLYSALGQQPPAVFDFDLSTLVLNKLAEPGLRLYGVETAATQTALHAQQAFTHDAERGAVTTRSRSTWLIVFACIFLTGTISAALYFMQNYFGDILSGVSVMITWLIIITVLLVLGFLVYDEYQKHNKQINSLDL